MTISRLASTSRGFASSNRSNECNASCCKLAICTTQADLDHRKRYHQRDQHLPCHHMATTTTCGFPKEEKQTTVALVVNCEHPGRGITQRHHDVAWVANVKPIRPPTQSGSVQPSSCPWRAMKSHESSSQFEDGGRSGESSAAAAATTARSRSREERRRRQSKVCGLGSIERGAGASLTACKSVYLSAFWMDRDGAAPRGDWRCFRRGRQSGSPRSKFGPPMHAAPLL